MTLADSPVSEPEALTPAGLIGLVRGARVARETAEREVFRLAGEWARSHEMARPVRRDQVGAAGQVGDGSGEWPDTPLDPTNPDAPGVPCDAVEAEETDERRSWRGLPELAWDCAAPFAAALGRTTTSGRVLLRQVLTSEHRLPRTHVLWEAGRVETARVRQAADAVAGQPDDVCAWVDLRLAVRVDQGRAFGPVVTERLIGEALLELHAEEEELQREAELQARYARIVPNSNRADPAPDRWGLAEFVIRGDWPDVKAFHDTITALAEAIRRSHRADASEPLDVRRATAVGVLADPVQAAALLGLTVAQETSDPTPTRRHRACITFHLAADAVTGFGARISAEAGVGLRIRRDGALVDQAGRPWLAAAVTDWLGRPDSQVTVRPVIHCGGCQDCQRECESHADGGVGRFAYRPTDLHKERAAIVNPHCVFPYCTRPAHLTDCDHIVPWDPDHPEHTPTCPRCNLAPLCRHHHRLKTHTGWTYRQPEPGVHTWTEPHRQTFTVTPHGTTDTTPAPLQQPAPAERR